METAGKPSEKGVYKVEDIMSILDIGKNSAYRLIKEGYFKSVRIGNAIRVSKSSFDEWLNKGIKESEI